MHRLLYCLLGLFALSLSFSACDNGAPPSGSAVRNRDSLPVMVTYGASKLISDSGVVRYKIISEEWLVFDRTHPPRQEFRKGVLLQRYRSIGSMSTSTSTDRHRLLVQSKPLGTARSRSGAQFVRSGDLYQ